MHTQTPFLSRNPYADAPEKADESCERMRDMGGVFAGLNVLGWGLSAYLAALSAYSEAGRLCDLLGGDCLGAVHSEYGRIFGLSLASIGLGYFTFQLTLTILLIRRRSPIMEELEGVQLLGAAAALSASLYFAYVLRFVLRQDCIACYGVHAINAAVFTLCLMRHFRTRRNLFLPSFQRLRIHVLKPALVLPLLLASNAVLAAGFLETNLLLHKEQEKIQANLDYYRYRHQSARFVNFAISPGDAVVGEPGMGLHQIVLLHKEGCSHCRRAKELLSDIVRKNNKTVYLVVKETSRLSGPALEEAGVRHVPAVFVDGRHAEGWQVPGFLEQFTEDCRC